MARPDPCGRPGALFFSTYVDSPKIPLVLRGGTSLALPVSSDCIWNPFCLLIGCNFSVVSMCPFYSLKTVKSIGVTKKIVTKKIGY